MGLGLSLFLFKRMDFTLSALLIIFVLIKMIYQSNHLRKL